MWDHDLPAGIAPAEDEQALPTRHFAPVEDALLFCFLLSYFNMSGQKDISLFGTLPVLVYTVRNLKVVYP